MTVSGWAEVALAIPLAAVAWAAWRWFPTLAVLLKLDPMSAAMRPMRIATAAFIAIAAAVALIAGLATAL